MDTALGKDIPRKEAWSKVTGAALYTNDIVEPSALHAKLLCSTYSHALILSVNTARATEMPGVKAVITGSELDFLCGNMLQDMPPLAKNKVRYAGEPVAIVIADNEQHAKAALLSIEVNYQPLPSITSISDAIKPDAFRIHENLMQYQRTVEDVYPIENTNICNHHKIRKGNMDKGWQESEITVEGTIKLPQSDHAAMETRTAMCKITPDNKVVIQCSTQAPFTVREEISSYFNIPEGNVIVKVPFVGGGFGGKAAIHLEVLAVIAAKAVVGRTVKLANTREEDMITSPCKLGLEASMKIGAKKNGKITAVEMHFYVDCGGYSEIAPKMTKAMAVDCAGPYHFENIQGDFFTVYTNHPLTTSFRGFGHTSQNFCLERMMDKLAAALDMDPLELRLINGVKEGDLTATKTKVTLSNHGNIHECLTRLKTLINWDEGMRVEQENNFIRAKGIACFCKTSDAPTDSVSSAIINFNSDGSINLSCGAVEIGPAMKTTAAQILAEKMKMNTDRIFVKMEVDSETSPKHWKTVASMTTFMMGRAIIRAAEDVIRQLLSLSAVVMQCPHEDLEIADEKVFLKSDPTIFTAFKDLVHGYKHQNGHAVMGPVIGRGSFIMNHLTLLDEETGTGKPGPSWTLGAQAVEVEYDKLRHTYRLLKAATVIDVGRIINPKTARGIIMGGMCMGLGLATSEDFVYDDNGVVQNTSFRTYKTLRYGETPDYMIEFVETPQIDAPFGARGLAEHGIIGIPAAVANAISSAAEVDITELPVTPELIWKKKTGGNNDFV